MPAPHHTLTRDIEWIDTDASGLYHYATAFRLAEVAETRLLRELGIGPEISGRTPRVHVEADFRAPLRFGDRVDVDFAVTRVGATSVTYRFTIRHGDVLAAEGTVVTAHVDGDGRPHRWPDQVRRALEGSDA